jgi:parallel beta-helix repeat protein
LSDGIQLDTNAGSGTVQNNYIGTDTTGTIARPNGYQGIAISYANGNTLKNNLVSGNARDGGIPAEL